MPIRIYQRTKKYLERLKKQGFQKGIYQGFGFKKGNIPWSKLHPEFMQSNSGSFKKGHPAPKTVFKKGSIPWNKGTKGICKGWNKGKKCPWVKNNPQIFKKGQGMGKKNKNYKNGRTKTKRGYILILKPEHPFCNNRRYVYEHRLIIEKQIGRYLAPKEATHHLGKKDDNRPKMLMAFTTQSAHMKFHKNPNNVKPEEIIYDGKNL